MIFLNFFVHNAWSATDSNWQELPLCQDQQEVCSAIYTAQPSPTRNPNILRFTDPMLLEPEWLELHLLRLQDPITEEATTLALLHLLSRSTVSSTQWEPTIRKLSKDSNPNIRAGVAELSKYASPEFQLEILQYLSTDLEPSVRASAMRSIARIDAASYQSILEGALLDQDTSVRLDAIQAIGWNNVPVDIIRLTPLLQDTDSTIRMHTLRSISRVHPHLTHELIEQYNLTQDTDALVQKEAFRLEKTR